MLVAVDPSWSLLFPLPRRIPLTGCHPSQSDPERASHKLQVSKHCSNMALYHRAQPQGWISPAWVPPALLPHHGLFSVGCSFSPGLLLWGLQTPSGLIHCHIIGSSMAAHGDLLCMAPTGCRGTTCSSMGPSWAAGSFTCSSLCTGHGACRVVSLAFTYFSFSLRLCSVLVSLKYIISEV